MSREIITVKGVRYFARKAYKPGRCQGCHFYRANTMACHPWKADSGHQIFCSPIFRPDHTDVVWRVCRKQN